MSARSQHRTEGPVEGLNLARSLRDCLASGVLVVNGREQIVSATPEVERLLHLAPLSLQPSAFSHRPASLLPGPLQSVVHEVIAGKTAIIREHLTLTLAGKHARDFHVTAQPIQRDGASLDVVVVISDVTNFARLEQQITHLDRLATLGTLSAHMAHEIKNALVPVKTFVDLLLEKHRNEELASIVVREMRRLGTIMQQMQRFSGKERSAHGPVRLHDVLEHSLHMVQHQLAGKFISLNRSFNATSDAVQGNDHQLEQVFVNLLLNAVEASSPKGSLTIATELVTGASARPGQPRKPLALRADWAKADKAFGSDVDAAALRGQPHVRITVADTGMGIAAENLDRMFEPFFTTKQDGTGLGLPITRRIIHEHQGQITVHSEPNKGTTFSILLPAGNQAR